nr:MAG TPA: hypothetical protein [Caudoviricetes sp.]
MGANSITEGGILYGKRTRTCRRQCRYNASRNERIFRRSDRRKESYGQ